MIETALIKKIKNGDQTAFREFVAQYEPIVAATVIGMLGACPEAEDVGQEVFVRFYRSIEKFRGDSSVKTYISRIAINLSLNELKRRKRRKQYIDDSSSENIYSIKDDSNQEWNDEKEVVTKALSLLDEKFRSVIVLRLMNGYSSQETADLLELPLGTVLSRLSRAQEKLRIILKPIVKGGNHEFCI